MKHLDNNATQPDPKPDLTKLSKQQLIERIEELENDQPPPDPI